MREKLVSRGIEPQMIISVRNALKEARERYPEGAYMLTEYVRDLYDEWLAKIDIQFEGLGGAEKTRPVMYMNELDRAWDDLPEIVDLKEWHYASGADEPTICITPPIPDTEPSHFTINLTPIPNGDEIIVTYDFSPTPPYPNEPDFEHFESWLHLINSSEK
jgi:hypothetical protein